MTFIFIGRLRVSNYQKPRQRKTREEKTGERGTQTRNCPLDLKKINAVLLVKATWFVCKHYVELLTACNISQSAESISVIWVSSVTPGPDPIKLTTVVGSFSQTCVREIIYIRSPVVTMRRLWVPSLAGVASGSHWSTTRIGSGTHVITRTGVWKNDIGVIVYRVKK